MKRLGIIFIILAIMLSSGCTFLNDPFPATTAYSTLEVSPTSNADVAPSAYEFPFSDFQWGKVFSFSSDSTFQHQQSDGAYIYEIRTKDPDTVLGMALSDGDMQLSMQHAYSKSGEWYTQSLAWPSAKSVVSYYVNTSADTEIRITQIQDAMIQPMPQTVSGNGAKLIGVYMLSERADISIASEDTAGAPMQLILVSATESGVSVLMDGFDENGDLLRMVDKPIQLDYKGIFALYVAASEDCAWSFTIDMAPDEISDELLPEEDGAVG